MNVKKFHFRMLENLFNILNQANRLFFRFTLETSSQTVGEDNANKGCGDLITLVTNKISARKRPY